MSDYQTQQSLDAGLVQLMFMVVVVYNQCLRRNECLNVDLDQFYVSNCHALLIVFILASMECCIEY